MLVLVGGCTDAEEKAPPPAPVVAPGAPGEPNRTLTSVPSPTPGAGPADLTFLRDMIVHHAQAVQMAELVPDRAASPAVRRLGARILAAQQPEIDAMGQMLEERGGTAPDLTHHEHTDHSAMAGMATPEQLARLATLDGAAFDRMFLQLMIKHHEGALVMVDDLLGGPSDIRVEELATEIGVTQRKEIAVMRELVEG